MAKCRGVDLIAAVDTPRRDDVVQQFMIHDEFDKEARHKVLVEGGVDATARKVVEEATEVLLAAKDDAAAETAGRTRAATAAALAGEAADLVYHLLVVLAERGAEPAAVIRELRARHERSR